MTIKSIKKESYPELIRRMTKNRQVYAPVTRRNKVFYGRIQSPEAMAENYILPATSAKSLLFPKVELLFSYTKTKDDVQVNDVDEFPKRVITGVRPCDARGIDMLRQTFVDAPADRLFEERYSKTTVIGMSCSQHDAYCFCGADMPGSTSGSDILLTNTGNGYLAEIVTEKGAALAEEFADLFEEPSGNISKEDYVTKISAGIDQNAIQKKLAEMFDSGIFEEQSLRCIACGTCAYVCPVCSCFDIQDETKGSQGRRLRCWDSCAFRQFTLHTSGHNPRNTQGRRWRQRLMHKFNYLPGNDHPVGCVGCGRCSRSCPVDMNILENLNQLVKNE